ncbi:MULTISPECIES: PTS fructose transporter subunit IIABC [Enterococcus]|uniref:PTS system mannose-specific EIIBCA component n=7 Tax=Enterococcus faecium TaxID=1352 RepID=J6KH30_ENTFC|nr:MULTISPECIES: PTS fructose transporter subunit IIABC [Enterococcus]AYM73354.1 PTS mannose transporter subunit IIABC [Enterococcus faecium]EJY46743.1 PTS system mannose-specific EIIBCA component [Enterococcus faecium 505]MBQ0861775.1 PTS fructose transporter subunit IIABC [Enterococcus lactis]MDQ8308004.1 PTS fructose transporter subunit IIABC [Enterococcus faecium]MDU5669167.1 PTS fructose transporter subunit IIABC [Enterococcus faecium]
MKKIIAITSCPVGIAHTYMAAENLEKVGKAVGAEVKVETHGSIGIENELTAKDIEEAAGVIIAADTKIDKSRFGGKPLITVGVQEGIHHADELVGEILAGKAPIYKSTETTISAENKSESENLGKKIYKSLMNGVSYMVPFVVTGGLLIAISLTLGGTATPEGIKIPEGTIWATMNSIGSIAMGLMVPILSAFIAQSIADRPGLVPGFVGGMLAANGALYGSDANAGFLGGIITGFLAGFIALGIKKVRVPKALQSIMPIIVIPILGSLAVGFVFIYVIGEPVALLFSSLTHFLAGMQGGSEIVLAMILGAMIAFDMGGPFNKVAFLFGSGLIAEGNYSIMGPIAVAICIPPLALGLASLILKTKFTKTEREAGKASLAMGLFGITEGAIPFASTDPLRVIPSIVVGAMTGSVIAMLSGVTDHVAHGGPIVAVLGAVDHVAMFFVAVVAGIAVTVLMLRILKPTLEHTAVAAANGVAVADLSESETSDVYTKTETFDSITDIMSDEAIVLGETATTKDGVIEDLVQRLEKTAAITDKNGFKEVIYDREKESTTGIGMGIAIPHGKSAYVRKPTVAFARSQDGVEWHSLDGKLAHMIFMIAVPENSQGDMHLKILQRLSRKLMDDDFRQALMDAPDKAAVHQLLSEM